jgi:hypothetical protein
MRLKGRRAYGLGALLFAFVVGFPTLLMTWELIDDFTILPYSVRIFTKGDFSAFSDATSGLLRPGYWTFQGLHGLVLGENVRLWHAARLGWSLVIVALFFKIVEEVSGSPRRAALAAVLYSMTCGALENQYRLGTAEPPLIILHLVALAAMLRPTRGRLVLACASAAVAYTVKELAVVMLGTAVLGTVLLREQRRAWAVFLAANGLSFAAIRISAFVLGSLTGGYSGRYGDLGDVATNTGEYGRLLLQNFNLLFPVAIGIAMAALWRPARREDVRIRWAMLWLGYAAGSILLYLPFWICCRHYFIQASLGIAAFVALVLPSPVGRRGVAAAAGLVLLTVWDFAANWNLSIQLHVRQSRFHAEVVRRIDERIPPGSRMMLAPARKDGDREPRDHMIRYLARRRPDLRFVESDPDVLLTRVVENPNVPGPPAAASGAVVHRLEKPMLQFSMALLARGRLYSAVERESWVLGR